MSGRVGLLWNNLQWIQQQWRQEHQSYVTNICSGRHYLREDTGWNEFIPKSSSRPFSPATSVLRWWDTCHQGTCTGSHMGLYCQAQLESTQNTWIGRMLSLSLGDSVLRSRIQNNSSVTAHHFQKTKKQKQVPLFLVRLSIMHRPYWVFNFIFVNVSWLNCFEILSRTGVYPESTCKKGLEKASSQPSAASQPVSSAHCCASQLECRGTWPPRAS